MSHTQIQLALWVSQPVMQAVIAGVMFRRKLHKNLPVFYTFIVFQIVVFAAQFSAYMWAGTKVYFNVFWISTSFNMILEFKIIHEIFLDAFRPYHALKDLGTALFKWSALIMILLSVVMIAVSPGWNDPLNKTVMVMHRCVRVTQCGMVLFLLAFSKPLGFSWKRLSFGVAVGFGLLAAVELFTNALFSGDHISSRLMNDINMTVYLGGCGWWFGYSYMAGREAKGPVLVSQRWDEALMDIHQNEGQDSLIPMFEHMVDRAFSRTQSHA